MKRNRLIWFLLWILALVGISHFGGTVSYGFFFALTLLPLISLIYLLFVYFNFRIYQETQSRNMVCGQSLPYQFVLRNESFLGFASIKVRMFSDFSYIESVAEDTEYELLPGDEFRYETKITCKYRGEYEIGVKEILLTDFFRIFQFRYRVPETINAIVHPRLVELNDVNGLSEITSSLQQNTSLEKKEPDVIVRNYMEGDSLKKIYWKASARTRELKVRPDVDEGKQNITLFFDTKRYSKRMEEYLPLESKILETLLALSLYFVKKNVQVTAYYGTTSIQQSILSGIRSFEEFYVRMSGTYFNPEVNPTHLLQECKNKGLLLSTKVFIGIFHRIDDNLLQLAEEISSQGTYVLLYIITDENIDNYLRENTSRKKVIAIPTEAELEVFL
ncbi:MAG: DUF58 domain-containing protein [Lachnospiraceae bacterium]|nr:DUF58 domain-containing protein [Lachnospiraceae bacterium]